jgi:hypothetical protein
VSRLRHFAASLSAAPRYRHVLLELLLLVAGILIALAVNGWIEDRREARTERHYLERLARDLDQDLEVLREFVAFETRQVDDAVLAYRPLCGEVAVSDRVPVSRALDHLMMRRTVRFARATYSDLLATGNLRLLSDAPLRDRIVRLYEANERWTAILDRNNQIYVDQAYMSFMMDAGLVVPSPDSNLFATEATRQEFARRLAVAPRSPVDRLWNLADADLDVLCGKLWYRGFVSTQAIDQANTVAGQIATVRDEIAAQLGRARSGPG